VATPPEERLRAKVRQLRDALRAVLALTRGPRDAVEVAILKRAAELASEPDEGP
jgi:hypothetical protein